MELAAFIVLTVLAIVSAAVVILHRNQVVAALALAGNLIAIAGFYLLLQAQFLALLQVIVYAGAIMVLILFVLMLLNMPEESRRARDPGTFQAGLGVVLAAAFVAVMGWAVFRAAPAEPFPSPSPTFGTVASVGMSLFRDYFYAFEAISLLLVVAMVGAVVLAKRGL